MKILVISQYYKPEPFRISDICESWVQNGHEVTVVTGIPNYPEGIIYDDYKSGQKRKEIIGGVRVFRTWTIERRKNVFFRFLNYYSYAISSALAVFRNQIQPESGGEFDVIFVQGASPVMMAYAALAYKWKKQVPIVLNCLDLWPESLQAGGVTKSSILYRYYHSVAKRIYRACDRILLPSEAYQSYMVKEFGIEDSKLVYVPQYAEEIFTVDADVRSEETFPRFVFAGNIGTAQGLDVIVDAAVLLKQRQVSVWFDIVGDGSDLERLKQRVTELGLSSVQFYGRKPVEEMPAFYNRASAFLVTLQDLEGMNRVLPGKVQSYMASGKPIIASINGETARIIEESHSGLVSAAEDAHALADCVEEFLKMPIEERLRFGQNAIRYYEEHFAKELVLEQIEQQLMEIKKK